MRAGRYLQIIVLASLVAFSLGQPARLRGFIGSGAAPQAQTAAAGPDVRLPLQDKSVRFAVIGDSGTGERHSLKWRARWNLPAESEIRGC